MCRCLIRQPVTSISIQKIIAAQSIAYAKASTNIPKAINQK